MADVNDDNELIQACRIPESKEYAYTQIVKKYQEKFCSLNLYSIFYGDSEY